MDLSELVVWLPLVELFLDPAAAFDGIGEILLELCVGAVAVGVQEFQQCGHRLADPGLVAALESLTEASALLDLVVEVLVF